MLRNIYILTVIITSYLLSSPVQSKSTNDYLSSSIKSTKEIHQWPTSTYELKHLKSAFKEFSRKNWRSSILRDYNPKDPVIKKILKWKELVSGSPAVNFSEIVEFVRYNPNWPSRETLNKKAEQNINSFTDPDDIIRWFAITPPIVDKEVKFRRPVTARGKKYLAEAMIKSHKKYKLEKRMIIILLKEAFVDMDFTLQGEKEFLEKYWKIIKKDDFQARVDRLLTDRELAAARRMTRYLDDGYKKVYDARIALIRGKSGVDDFIRQIPNEYKNDAGLAYERLKWRAKRNMEDGVISLLKKSPKIVTNPEKWWSLRWKYTKEFISQGNYKDAYFIIRKHSITTDNVKISKAEWISGWLALRFLNNPTEAINHFERMYNVVSTPVSLARGAYWLGRAYKQKGLDDKAKEWFLKAAEHPLTYYGQLGYVEAGDRKYSLPKAQTISKSDLSNYKKNELAKAAYIMMQIGENYTGKLFSVAAAEEAQSFGEKMLIAQFGLDIGKYDYAVRAAKKIYANTKEPILNALYPIFKLETINQRPIRNPSKEVVLAIIRQESEFDKDALSGAGARGLMQLMPSTAKYVAKRLGIKYDKSRLVSDVNYNITLGSAYLADRINIFDGSYVLAFASYNAGEGNVKKWIKKNGDPRDMKLYDVIDWVEKIPFSETNNYVQRVMENVQVYRLALTDERYNKITIDQDLIR